MHRSAPSASAASSAFALFAGARAGRAATTDSAWSLPRKRLVARSVAAATWIAAAALLPRGASAELQTSAQQRCMMKVTSAGAKVARTQGKEVRSCLRAASRAELSTDDGLGCVLADLRNRVASARAKTTLAVARSCAVPPTFGFTSAEIVNTAAVEEGVGLSIELFGTSLALAAFYGGSDPTGAACQASMQSSTEKLLAAKLKLFTSCQRDGLKRANIASADDLSDCILALKNPANTKTTKIVDKIEDAAVHRCNGVDTSEAFPGRCDGALTPGALRDCAVASVDCRACTMLAAMHGLAVDCDAFDDGLANSSCTSGTTTTTLPPGAGACTNSADEAVLASVDIQAETTTCTLGCLGSPTRPQCIAACIVAATGLGAECSLCYGESSNCGILNCAGECAVSQTAPACVQCLENAGCIDAFDECAGTGFVTTTTFEPSTTVPPSSTTTTLGGGGACANPADEAVDAAYDLQAEATACTLGCLSAPSLPQCVAACLSAETGLSGECALCYGQSSQCGIQHCAAECAVDQSAPACVACLDQHCMPAFEVCALEGGTTTTLDTTTTTSGPTTTTTPPPTTTLPPAPGECTNPADEAVLASLDIQAETTACTLGCLSAPDIAQCVATCVSSETGLSPGCSLCYGESSECGITFCAAECAVNQSAPACVACLNANCIPAFNECAGTSGATTTTVEPTTTTTLVPPTTTTTTLPPAGSCDNPSDEAVDDAFDLQAQATTCTVGCLSAPNRVACVTACLSGATGLSNDCAGCYAQSAECGLLNCAAECAVNQSSIPCQTCLAANCIPAFETCAGTGDPPPPASCTNGTLDAGSGETDVDCGGPCDGCAIGDDCSIASDCVSGECVAGMCSAPTTPIALGSCLNGYLDPLTDPDAIDLGGAPATGSDDGYRLTLASPADVFVEVTNQSGATSTLRAAIVTAAGDGSSTVPGLLTGLVDAGQNGTGGPEALNAGTYYLYVDSALADTYGGYQICVVPPPTVAIDSCIAANVGNGDGDDVQIAGASGAGGDKGIRFTPPVGTSNVILRVRNLSGGANVAAAMYLGSTKLPGSETPDAMLFTERNAGPFPVSANQAYTIQVDTADADSFSTFEVCVFKAGCGDGLVTGGEQCDDNNVVGGDGCSATCTLESGKIVVGSCRSDNIPLFGSDCDDWTLPIASNRSIFLELTNPAGGTLLGIGSLRLGGSQLASTGNVPIGQTGSTSVVNVTPNTYTARVCDVTGAGTGNYTVCIRPARRIELGTCFSSNVTDGDGNAIDLAGPISGGDEDVIFQPPRTTTVRLTLSNESVGGLLAAGVYDGQPGSLLPGSAVGQSPNPLAVGQTGQSGLFEVNVGQVYRVYTDIASLGTAGTNYTICLAEVEGDACLNPEDETVRSSHNLNEEAEAAGLSCTGSASCISSTLQNDTGLSAGCADCYGSVGACAASNCAFQCLGDSSSSGCRSCVASSCAAEFEVCSGWVYGQ